MIKFLEKNDFITIEEAKKQGVSLMLLSRLVEAEELFRTERSIYTNTLDWLTDPLKKYLPACTLYPNAVVSGISALTYYDLTDEEERRVWLTIPKPQIIRNPQYHTVRSQGLSYSLGIKKFKFGKRTVRIYDPEKTVIDALKHHTEEVGYKALKSYLKWKDKDIHKLCRYGEQLRKPIEDKVRLLLAEEYK